MPYHSWERSANEPIRKYILLKAEFDGVSEVHITEIEWQLSNRPSKSLGGFALSIYKFSNLH